jgi:diguanylate cyclase (GGDEF)-like protein
MAGSGAGQIGVRRIAARWVAGATAALLVVYPVLPGAARQAIFLMVQWLTIVPVALVLRTVPNPLRVPVGLLVAGLVAGAADNTPQLLTLVGRAFGGPVSAALPIGAELLFLAAAIGVVLRRGRHDFGGLIDASLASLAIGGLLWNVILLPHLHAAGQDAGSTAPQAVLVMVMTATLGALLHLIETDRTANRALRLLLGAVSLNLLGFVLVTSWPAGAVWLLGEMAFIAATAAVVLAVLHPTMAELVEPGQAQPAGLGTGRLTVMGAAMLSAPVVAGIRLLQGHSSDSLVLLVAAALIASLVIVRIALLANQLNRSQAALRHLATHDPLTDAMNRRGFSDVLAAEIRRSQDFVLVFCDLNGFKVVNDRFGHAAGDSLLIEVADRLRACAGRHDVVCRLGGDEFVLLVRDGGPVAAGDMRQRILDAMRAPYHYDAADITISASIGSVVSDARRRRGSATAERLIDEADAAMYADKAVQTPS